MKYLNGTKEYEMILTAEDLSIIKWHVDATFAVNSNFKSQTGAIMRFGGHSTGSSQTI